MKFVAKVMLFLTVILFLSIQVVYAKSPSTSELRNVLSLHLPAYIKLTDFSVEASQNLGSEVEPNWGARFNAVILATTDLYSENNSENNVVFVSLSVKKNSKLDIFGKIYSTLYRGKWRHNIDIDGSPVFNLGLPLTAYSKRGNRIIVRGSIDEKTYYNNLQKERKLQKEAEERRSADERKRELERENRRIAEPYHQKGVKAFKDEQFDEAVAYFSKAVDIYSKYWEAYDWRGWSYIEKGDLDKALSDHIKAAELASDNHAKAWTNFVVGSTYKKKENFKLADKYFAISLEFWASEKNDGRDKARSFNGIAWFYATCKNKAYRDAQKAIKYATEACVLKDWNEPAYIDTLAAAYAEAGNYTDAVRMQEKAIKIVKAVDKGDYEQRLRMYMNKQKPE
ncbi:MAG: tetratricopeptide repeat protein [Desulfobacter postgatei]|uniref:tetratricopeptide repeat protein n=1 Tax=Desulfobacter postgatei TaxID=2293 RepID=UPI0023F26A0A|nr:tetratricopeptide repeat protein [Desulfobacter postgatei]MDD4275275.1 tetratricopeptide repeat protein [Desulfobacter postgatei]